MYFDKEKIGREKTPVNKNWKVVKQGCALLSILFIKIIDCFVYNLIISAWCVACPNLFYLILNLKVSLCWSVFKHKTVWFGDYTEYWIKTIIIIGIGQEDVRYKLLDKEKCVPPTSCGMFLITESSKTKLKLMSVKEATINVNTRQG